MFKKTKLRQMTAIMVIAMMVVTVFPVHASERRLANCDVCGVGLMVEVSSKRSPDVVIGKRSCVDHVYGVDIQYEWTTQRVVQCNNCSYGFIDPAVRHTRWVCEGYDQPKN